MHPVKYHLEQKLTWMSRRLRSKNDAVELLDWTRAMQSIYTLLVALSENKFKLQDRLPCRKNFSISSHQGINYVATIKNRLLSINSQHPDEKQKRRVVIGERTVKRLKEHGPPQTFIQPAKPTIAKSSNISGSQQMMSKRNSKASTTTGSIDWSFNLPPPPDSTPISISETEIQVVNLQDTRNKTDERQAVNLRETMSDETKQEEIKCALWYRMNKAGKDPRWYKADKVRLKKLINIVEKDLGITKDTLLKGEYQRALTLKHFNSFFAAFR